MMQDRTVVNPNDIIGMRVVRGIDVEGDITSMAGQVGVIIRRMPSRKPLRYGVTAEQILKEQQEEAKEMAKPDPPTQDEVKLMEFCALKSAAFARDVLNRFETVEASINFCTSNPESEIEFIALHTEQNTITTSNISEFALHRMPLLHNHLILLKIRQFTST